MGKFSTVGTLHLLPAFAQLLVFIIKIEDVCHALRLCAEVALTVNVGLSDDCLSARDLDPKLRKLSHLHRIVGHELHRLNSQISQDEGNTPIHPLVVPKPKSPISIHRIQPLILQVVRRHLVRQADAPALLREVDDGPPLLLHHIHRHLELLPAVTSPRPHNLRGEALVMHTHEHVLLHRVALDALVQHHRLHIHPLEHLLAVACHTLGALVPVRS
mmetsp:Transcript_25066/g.48774  ORF Transcript_25066/g.48774 Transcript_25066/m.48774 type:complete len:216 (-) Transcript_25066:183-830(-)